MIIHWTDLCLFASESLSPALRELSSLMNGEESAMDIKVALLSMAACWTCALEDFWRQDRDLNMLSVFSH